jgi:hypothetical protein
MVEEKQIFEFSCGQVEFELPEVDFGGRWLGIQWLTERTGLNKT